jgi:hypothetical protein
MTEVISPETRPFSGADGVSRKEGTTERAGVGETLRPPAALGHGASTEDLPRSAGETRIEKNSAVAGIEAPVTQPQPRPAPASAASGGRKGMALVGALVVVALAAAAYFVITPSKSSVPQETTETPGGSPPALAASPAASAQPTAQTSIAAATEQPSPQQSPTNDDTKSAQKQGGDDESKPQPQPTGPDAKPAAPSAPGAKGGEGSGAAQHNLNQGIEYMSGGKYAEALREFDYVRKLDPDNKSVFYLIGQTYHKMGQLDRALDAYRQCTSGVYASVAQSNIKMLEKRLGKSN